MNSKVNEPFVNGPSPHARFHGGGVNAAARALGIPRERWLDLSTGINPHGYPVGTLPAAVWRRLPEDDDGLEAIALGWFRGVQFDSLALANERLERNREGASGCLPVAGSQAALQLLPSMRAPCRVGVPAVGYAEHELAWRAAGHLVTPLQSDEIDAGLAHLDVLVCINPNNPTGEYVPVETLIGWHQRLSTRGGWLVVDEAFIQGARASAESLAQYYFQLCAAQQNSGLIILRSLGKFFGLAGVRAGMMFASAPLCAAMNERLGPWALSHPGRHVMARALADVQWQTATSERLSRQRKRLEGLLLDEGFTVQGCSDLFVYCPHPLARQVAAMLAEQAVLVRAFDQPAALRFGLPGDEPQWLQLARALSAVGNGGC